MRIFKRLILTLTAIVSCSGIGFSQTNYSVNTEGSDLTIYGTSSLHDWQIVAEKMQGKCVAVIKNGKVETINELNFIIEVNGLKSGKSGMDDNTYLALNNDKFPTIKYVLNQVERTAPSNDQVSTVIVTKGTLTVAEVSKEIDLKVAAKSNSDGSIQFIGSTVFNMTDYQIDPPIAVFGTISTGNEITIVFKIIFKE
jgi:hypothetical protein